VDESVREDMTKLEDTFPGISERFRLINRIGEGMLERKTNKYLELHTNILMLDLFLLRNLLHRIQSRRRALRPLPKRMGCFCASTTTGGMAQPSCQKTSDGWALSRRAQDSSLCRVEENLRHKQSNSDPERT
jgi:hypothetical protein